MKNFRDIGYENIKKGLLFRSEALISLSKEDQTLLMSKNLRTVVDLRTLDENQREKDMDLPSVKNVSISILPTDKESQQEIGPVNVMGLQLPDLAVCYRQLVRPNRKEMWTEIFNLLLEDNDPVLFHCSQGKDRTGVVVAMILSALGVSKETIYQDYLLTNVNPVFAPSYEQFAATLPEEVRKAFFAHFGANKEYLDAMFDEINKVYGSINSFFKECCSLDEDKLKALRTKYLK